MTIWERTKNALSVLGLPMAASALIVATEAERPDEYLIYFEVSSPPEQFADNQEKQRSHTMQVSYYNRAGLTAMPDLRGAMAAAGFMPGAARELPYNPDTRHFGYAMDFVYVE